MNKEKEIEEMVDVLWGHCGNLINEYCEGESHCANCIAKKLTDAGYRKADEVSKETAKKISNWLNEHSCYEEHYQLVDLFDEVFGIEVDE